MTTRCGRRRTAGARIRGKVWPLTHAGDADRGSALVEFLGVSLVMLVPLVYLIVTLGQIQSAGFAAEGAAREAGRLIAQADTFEQGLSSAHMAAELAFADQGLAVDGANVVEVTCQQEVCLTPGSYVHIRVSAPVDLPAVPAFMAGALPSVTQVEAEALTAIPRYREVGR